MFFYRLEKIIHERKGAHPDTSYTARLFAKGQDAILQKVGEEAVEYILDAKNRNRERAISEASDLFYHLLVSLAEQGIALRDVEAELERRHKI